MPVGPRFTPGVGGPAPSAAHPEPPVPVERIQQLGDVGVVTASQDLDLHHVVLQLLLAGGVDHLGGRQRPRHLVLRLEGGGEEVSWGTKGAAPQFSARGKLGPVASLPRCSVPWGPHCHRSQDAATRVTDTLSEEDAIQLPQARASSATPRPRTFWWFHSETPPWERCRGVQPLRKSRREERGWVWSGASSVGPGATAAVCRRPRKAAAATAGSDKQRICVSCRAQALHPGFREKHPRPSQPPHSNQGDKHPPAKGPRSGSR